jgi:RNA polymerase sigma-70 factor, ECF subfamily
MDTPSAHGAVWQPNQPAAARREPFSPIGIERSEARKLSRASATCHHATLQRRLFRVARRILRDDAEAEDVVQETYVRAFTGLDHFA